MAPVLLWSKSNKSIKIIRIQPLSQYFCCFNIKVVSKALLSLPKHIKSDDTLFTFFDRLKSCTVCTGNMDTKFKPLIGSRRGIFTSTNGMPKNYIMIVHIQCIQN